MSYIRSTSNPEALHVFKNGELVEFMWNIDKMESAVVLYEDFKNLMDIYNTPKFNLTDVIVTPSIALIPPTYEQNDTKITLEFKDFLGLEVKLWRSTFEEMANEHRRQKFRSFRNRLKFLFNKLYW